jgi:hypothetical protein
MYLLEAADPFTIVKPEEILMRRTPKRKVARWGEV